MPRCKQFLYDGGVLIPLIVRVPEKYRPADWKPGSGSDQLVSHIDITATTLAVLLPLAVERLVRGTALDLLFVRPRRFRLVGSGPRTRPRILR